MKKVSDLRAKYYEEETEKRKLDFDGSVKLARTLACKDDKNSILKKYERMLRTIVESEKMKLKLNFKILRWVNLFISNIKKAIHKPESPKPPPLQLRLLASKQDQNSLLFRLKLKYPSSKIIKR